MTIFCIKISKTYFARCISKYRFSSKKNTDIYFNEVYSLYKNEVGGLSGKPIFIDSTIILEYPYLSTHIDSIINNIAKEIKLDVNRISIKATTNDGLGFIGQGKGISVITTSLIIKE